MQRLVWWLWAAGQIVVMTVTYAYLKYHNPDIANSAIAVTAFFCAFLATAIPVAVFDLLVRLRRRRLPTNERLN